MPGCRLARVRDKGVEDDAAEVIGMTEVLLAVGTRKGLFIGRRRGGTWEFDESPYFNAQAVYSVALDTGGDTPRLLAGGDSAHWGPSVFHSDDLGRTWTEPAQPAVKFPKETGASLERVWQLHPAATRNRTWSTRARNRPRCTARRTAARASSWSGPVGAPHAVPVGAGAAAARGCTPCSPTSGTRSR